MRLRKIKQFTHENRCMILLAYTGDNQYKLGQIVLNINTESLTILYVKVSMAVTFRNEAFGITIVVVGIACICLYYQINQTNFSDSGIKHKVHKHGSSFNYNDSAHINSDSFKQKVLKTETTNIPTLVSDKTNGDTNNESHEVLNLEKISKPTLIMNSAIAGTNKTSSGNQGVSNFQMNSQPTLMKNYIFTAAKRYTLENGFTKMDDPYLVEYIKQKWLIPPSQRPYRLMRRIQDKTHTSLAGQAIFVDNLLARKTRGFFVEVGAYNGQDYSNSLFFERFRGWTGLLIEANPQLYQKILWSERKSYSIECCLSLGNQTEKVVFHLSGVGSQIVTETKHINYNKTIIAQCFHLYSILLAVGRTHIDYFSLDIEGQELLVLHTLPFDKLTINVIGVAYRVTDNKGNIDKEQTLDKLKQLREFFNRLEGYKEVNILPKGPETFGLDVFFYAQSYHERL